MAFPPLLAACVLWPLIAAQSTVPADLCPVVNTALSKLPACTASASCETITCTEQFTFVNSALLNLHLNMAFQAVLALDPCSAAPTLTLTLGMTSPATLTHTFVWTLNQVREFRCISLNATPSTAACGAAVDARLP